MWKKIIIISLCISVLFVFSVPTSSVNAGEKTIPVKWNIAGTIVASVPLYSPVPPNPSATSSLLNLSAQGPPGPAQITALSSNDLETGSEYAGKCPYGYTIQTYFNKIDGVALSSDQSILIVSIDSYSGGGKGGILCFKNDFRDSYFKVDMAIKGGWGSYDEASGTLTAEGYDYSFGEDGTINVQIGTITGDIEFND